MKDVIKLSAAVVSSVLLVLAVGCSLEKKTPPDKSQDHSASSRQYHQDQDNTAKPTATELNTSSVANPFCLVCHADFQDEKLVLRHERAGIGCERCHGESDRHRSDEANITPPEIMYPRERINPTCMMCHPRGQINHIDAHATILAGAHTALDNTGVSSQTGNNKKVCTSCHGEHHQMNQRTIHWNKATGELLTKG